MRICHAMVVLRHLLNRWHMWEELPQGETQLLNVEFRTRFPRQQIKHSPYQREVLL